VETSSDAPAAIASIRLIPELRSVHVERFFETTPALMVYFSENYDLSGITVPRQFRKVRLSQAVRLVFSASESVLEMPEPLWMRFLPRGIVLAAAWRIGGVLRRRTRILATYAMENNDLQRLIGGTKWVPKPAARAFAFAVGLFMRLFFHRLAFASEGSRDLYNTLPFVAKIPQRLFEELPSPELSGSFPSDSHTPSAVFVGVLEERKGVRQLMRAWEKVEGLSAKATLSIIGPGPLDDEVRTWVALNEDRRAYLGQLPRSEVLRSIGSSTVLVAPSMPSGRWREQVGLPIKEALARGLTVITTDQTGLAGWLERHGHRIVPVVAIDEQLAPTIVDALEDPLDRKVVQSALPKTQGRYQADTWMHSHSDDSL
jgi:glycosyltransferase involved in cell wall biosynthesis